MILEPPSSFHSFRMLFLFLLFASSVFLLYRFQRLQTLKTLTGHNVSLRLSEGSPAERAHQEVILPFMSMIDDARLQDKGFEKIPPACWRRGKKKANCLDSPPRREAACASRWDTLASARGRCHVAAQIAAANHRKPEYGPSTPPLIFDA